MMMDSEEREGLVVPTPTRDFEEGLENLRRYGLTIVPDALSARQLMEARDALYRAAESDAQRKRSTRFSLDYETDLSNRRVWNVLSRDPVFEDLAFHDIAVSHVKAMLGWPALLGNLSANITGPGGGEMILHADQIFVPEPWPPVPQGLNVAWCLDDFTDENGATRFVPGSHRLNRAPREDELQSETVAMEAPAGSALIFESRVWHKTGHNRSRNIFRAGVFGWYHNHIYRPQENWFLSLRPEIRQFASDDALTLLGWKSEGLGLVNGMSPA
ncbi:phytanoyl-CoA dioxygenase family protein [Sandaracinobacteroides sp. A072]|uniref:phytanoyl-CoA dioxygenase family protein n=1 Tax=Sandaracinobacteroides sp. A072 TaxID=3461146 RepID=UPI0040430589